MGVKARKEAITKKLKNGANDLSASSASKDEARDSLPLEGGPAQKLPKTEVRENKATVLYIGRILHGFYENEMEARYEKHLEKREKILAKNRKTWFQGMQLKRVLTYMQSHGPTWACFYVTQWKGVNRWYKPLDWVKIERKRQDKERTLDDHKKLVEGILKRDKKRQKRIEAARIDYDCPEIAAPKKIRFDAD